MHYGDCWLKASRASGELQGLGGEKRLRLLRSSAGGYRPAYISFAAPRRCRSLMAHESVNCRRVLCVDELLTVASNSVLWSRRQRKTKLGADVLLALYGDRAAVRFNKFLNDGQPKSATFSL
jgi:hypothetical protein